jgi:hypothetical protein
LQLVAPSSVHSLSGSEPALMLPQAPSTPVPFFAAEHAWHKLLHPVSQQTPSTQLPLWHCVDDVHAAPFA